MLNFEEYKEVFDIDIDRETFDTIMGGPIRIQDAVELIFVDPETHEKIVFKRTTEEAEE